MSVFPKAVKAADPRNYLFVALGIFGAGLFTVLAVVHLFKFEDSVNLVLSALLVASEVFALPFLLRMPLSPLFRWFSMLCGWVAVMIWLYLTAKIGGLIFIASIALAIIIGLTSWGLWPARVKPTRKS